MPLAGTLRQPAAALGRACADWQKLQLAAFPERTVAEPRWGTPAGGSASEARFLNEARAAAIVDHPGIVDIFEYGRLPDGTTFLVMEFLKGRSLRALLKQEGKLVVSHALRITRQIASALAAAHEKGIIHRGEFAASPKRAGAFQRGRGAAV